MVSSSGDPDRCAQTHVRCQRQPNQNRHVPVGDDLTDAPLPQVKPVLSNVHCAQSRPAPKKPDVTHAPRGKLSRAHYLDKTIAKC